MQEQLDKIKDKNIDLETKIKQYDIQYKSLTNTNNTLESTIDLLKNDLED